MITIYRPSLTLMQTKMHENNIFYETQQITISHSQKQYFD